MTSEEIQKTLEGLLENQRKLNIELSQMKVEYNLLKSRVDEFSQSSNQKTEWLKLPSNLSSLQSDDQILELNKEKTSVDLNNLNCMKEKIEIPKLSLEEKRRHEISLADRFIIGLMVFIVVGFAAIFWRLLWLTSLCF